MINKTEKIVKDAIRTEVWNYLKEKQLTIYVKKVRNGQHSFNLLYAIENNSNMYEKMKEHRDGYITSCNDLHTFLHSFSSYTDCIYLPNCLLEVQKEQELHLDFFKHCCEKLPTYQKKLLGNYLIFKKDPQFSKETFLFHLIDFLTPIPKERLKILSQFPITTLDINLIPLSSIERYWINNGLNDTQVDKALISYLKTRQNQLKISNVGCLTRDYLISKYHNNIEKLKPYFDFFDILKARYEIPKSDFILNKEKFSTIITVSCKKMKTSFLLNNWEPNDYSIALIPILKAFKSYFKLSSVYVIERDKAEKIEQINFLHDNENFNKNVFENNLVEYFHFLYENPIAVIDLDANNILQWLSKKDLHKELLTMEVSNKPSSILKI